MRQTQDDWCLCRAVPCFSIFSAGVEGCWCHWPARARARARIPDPSSSVPGQSAALESNASTIGLRNGSAATMHARSRAGQVEWPAGTTPAMFVGRHASVVRRLSRRLCLGRSSDDELASRRRSREFLMPLQMDRCPAPHGRLLYTHNATQ